MSDLETVRQELLERGDEMISFRQLVERFDEIEEVYPNEPWNLVQIYSNFNILIGEKPNKWISADVLDKIRDEFISLYPRNYAGELELGGVSCVFSLNKILNIINKYKVNPIGAEGSDKE